MVHDWKKLPKDLDVNLMKDLIPLIEKHGYRILLKHIAEHVHIDIEAMCHDNDISSPLVKIRHTLDNLYIETSFHGPV